MPGLIEYSFEKRMMTIMDYKPHPTQPSRVEDSTSPLHMERGGRNFYIHNDGGVRLKCDSKITSVLG